MSFYVNTDQHPTKLKKKHIDIPLETNC